MNKFCLAALTAMGLVAGSAGAFAADLYGGSMKDNGGYVAAAPSRPALFYVRGDFSLNSNDFGSLTEAPNYTLSGTSIASNHAFGGGLGMYFSPHVRGDLTLDFSSNAAISGSVLDGAATVQGQRNFGVKHMVGLANVYYDFDTRGRFTPYLGVGLGFSRNTTTAGTVDIVGCDAALGGVGSNCAASTDGVSKMSAAGAFMAGFTTRIGDRWSLDAGYRFLYTGDAQTSDINITRSAPVVGAPNSTPAVQVHDLYEHEIRVGLRMDLR